MSLTKTDLKAIKGLLDETAEEIKIHTAAGFAEVDSRFMEVHKKIDDVDARLSQKIDVVDKKLSQKINDVDARLSQKIDDVDDHVGRVERIVSAEVRRTDEQSSAIKRIRKQLKAV